MKRELEPWTLLMLLGALVLGGCAGSGAYHSGGVRTSIGFGFYQSTFGHGWGSGYYRGYDDGMVDTLEAVETIETLETLDAMDAMGVPDMDMDMGLDFD